MTIFLFTSPDAVDTTGEIAAKSRPVGRPEAKTEMQITRIRSRLRWSPPRAGPALTRTRAEGRMKQSGFFRLLTARARQEKAGSPDCGSRPGQARLAAAHGRSRDGRVLPRPYGHAVCRRRKIKRPAPQGSPPQLPVPADGAGSAPGCRIPAAAPYSREPAWRGRDHTESGCPQKHPHRPDRG